MNARPIIVTIIEGGQCLVVDGMMAGMMIMIT